MAQTQNILPDYNQAMDQLAWQFQDEIIKSLKQGYKYAPGFTNQRSAFGVAPKVATGGLVDSVNVQFNDNSNEIIVEMLDYWRYVNDGRRPGKYAPFDAIKSWVKAKGLKGRDKKTGRFITDDSFVWGINTNIKKFGIAPTYFYDKAVENFERVFEQEVYRALEIDLNRFFESVFDQDIN
jgi:hypothetical protein